MLKKSEFVQGYTNGESFSDVIATLAKGNELTEDQFSKARKLSRIMEHMLQETLETVVDGMVHFFEVVLTEVGKTIWAALHALGLLSPLPETAPAPVMAR